MVPGSTTSTAFTEQLVADMSNIDQHPAGKPLILTFIYMPISTKHQPKISGYIHTLVKHSKMPARTMTSAR